MPGLLGGEAFQMDHIGLRLPSNHYVAQLLSSLFPLHATPTPFPQLVGARLLAPLVRTHSSFTPTISPNKVGERVEMGGTGSSWDPAASPMELIHQSPICPMTEAGSTCCKPSNAKVHCFSLPNILCLPNSYSNSLRGTLTS